MAKPSECFRASRRRRNSYSPAGASVSGEPVLCGVVGKTQSPPCRMVTYRERLFEARCRRDEQLHVTSGDVAGHCWGFSGRPRGGAPCRERTRCWPFFVLLGILWNEFVKCLGPGRPGFGKFPEWLCEVFGADPGRPGEGLSPAKADPATLRMMSRHGSCRPWPR